MKIVLQSEMGECGMACLAMICDSFGLAIGMGDMRRQFTSSSRGNRLSDLISRAGALGLDGRAVKLDIQLLHKLKTPCILHWDMNHFVVLQKVSARAATILDPAVGKRKITLRDRCITSPMRVVAEGAAIARWTASS